MEVDLKLMHDIAPYSNAYGHSMSNLIYRYHHAVGICNLEDNEINRRNAEWYERVIRSFLITRNISYSKTLVSNDMGIKESEIVFPSTEGYNFYSDYVKPHVTILKDIQAEIRKERKFKSDLEIRLENYEFSNPDSLFVKAMRRFYEGRFQTCIMTISELSFHCTIYTYKDNPQEFFVRVYRYSNGSVNKYPFDLPAYQISNMFPEIHNIEWKEGGKIYE